MAIQWKRGIYVQPDAVVAAPDYARRLVEEAGVDHFVLRSGYGLEIPEALERAIQVARDVKADVCCLVGTWWYPNMKEIDPPLPTHSFESQFPMRMPGSVADAGIIAKLEKLCGRYQPDAICLTHARYRHPAYIDGIFDEGREDSAYQARMEVAGVPRQAVLGARAIWERALGAADKDSLMKAAERGMIGFLCELAQSDVPKRFFAFRRETIAASYHAFHDAVKAYDGIAFGSNAYSPIAAGLCGHDYDIFDEVCEFVQPLLSYMEYHRLQLLAAWGYYLRQHAPLDEPSAIEIAKRLFYLSGAVCPASIAELDAGGEGDDRTVHSVVSTELKLCAPYLSKPYRLLPVLRGNGWRRTVIANLMEEARHEAFDAFVWMGCEYLLAGSPSKEGWF